MKPNLYLLNYRYCILFYFINEWSKMQWQLANPFVIQLFCAVVSQLSLPAIGLYGKTDFFRRMKCYLLKYIFRLLALLYFLNVSSYNWCFSLPFYSFLIPHKFSLKPEWLPDLRDRYTVMNKACFLQQISWCL